MATIFKRDNSPYWYARFSYKGKRYCISTEKTNKKDAEAKLKEELELVKGEASLVVLFDQVLSEVAKIEDKQEQDSKRREMAGQLLQGTSAKLEVSKAWDAWLKNPKKRNPSERTLNSYKGQWDRYTLWMQENHSSLVYLHEASPMIAEEYAADLWDSNITPSTYNRHINFLRAIFKVLKVRGGMTMNVWDDIPSMEKAQEGRRNFTPKELKKVCSQAKGDLRYMIAISLYTGLRLGDVVTLKWKEVKLSEGIIERIPMKTKRKNKKVRASIHPVLQLLLEELRQAVGKQQYLFPEAVKVYEKDNSKISKQIQKFFQECGIETTEQPANGHRKKAIVRVGFQSLRHSFVSLCAANRVPQVAIMELVGHGSPAMTALYSHAGDEQKAKAIAALPTVDFGELEK